MSESEGESERSVGQERQKRSINLKGQKESKLENVGILDKIKRLTNTEDKKRLLSNFVSLSVLQGANYILPLITLPYLVRVLGPEKYGLIAFAQAFIQYFNILTDYGFNLSATREVSIYRDDKEKVSEIFSSVMIIKFGLLILSFIIMTVLVFSFGKFRQDWLIYFLTFGMVVGQVLFPVWFFQGMERMKYITYLNITARLIFTVAIFVFIHQASDYIYVPFLNFMGSLLAGALSLWIVFRNFNVNFKLPSMADIKHQLREGWYIFISTMAISLYTTSNTFILGLFTNNTIVGYYSGAEKIIKAIQGLLSPVSQAIYPHISKLASGSKEKAIKFIRKIALLVGGASFILSLVVFIFADIIVKLLLGNQYQESIVVLRILAFIPFIVALTNMFGAQLLLPFNIKRLFTLSIIIPSVLHIVLLFFAASIFREIGVSIVAVFTESLILVFRMSGLYLFHKDLFLGLVHYGER